MVGLIACGGAEPVEEPPPPEPVEEAEPEAEAVPEPEPEPVEEPAEPDEEPAATGEPELLWRAEHEHHVLVIAPSPDGVHLAVGSGATYDYLLADGRLVDGGHREPVDHVPYDDQIADLAFSPDGSLLAVAGRPAPRIDGQVHVFDTGTGELVALIEPQRLHDQDFVVLNSVAVGPDGGHVVLGRQDGAVEVWRLPGAESSWPRNRSPASRSRYPATCCSTPAARSWRERPTRCSPSSRRSSQPGSRRRS